MAEEEGFEPSVQVSSHGHLATPCISINISINTVSYNKNSGKHVFRSRIVQTLSYKKKFNDNSLKLYQDHLLTSDLALYFA
jgi:hypothetical protein